MGENRMGIADKLKGMLGKKEEPKKSKKKLSPKEQATKDGEPWVEVLSMDINADSPDEGAFELDWNDTFVAKLVKAGYAKDAKDKDADIVDRWFKAVCKNVVMEGWEQEQADPEKRVKSKDLGNGRSEIS